jgi:uncharacterized membrane protein
VSFTGRWRRYFFVGLVVIAPAGVTVFVLQWLFRRIDDILGQPLEAALGVHIPGLGFVLLAVFVFAVGWVVHQAVGRRLLGWWNGALARFPVVGRLYHATSQIFQTVISDRQKFFRRTVLVPYPTEGMWAVAFVTSEDAHLGDVIGEPCVNVFVPTTPNPTSGFLLIVPRRLTRETSLSIEDAMKLVISAGAVSARGQTQIPSHRGLDIDTLLEEQSR